MKKFAALFLALFMVIVMIPPIAGPAVLAEDIHHFSNCDDTTCNDEGCNFTRAIVYGHLLEDGHVYYDCFDVDCERCGIVTGIHHDLSTLYYVPKGEYDKCQEIQYHCSRDECDYYIVEGYDTCHHYLNCMENICSMCPYNRGPVSGSLYYYGHVYDDCFDVGCNRCPYIWTGTPPGHIYLSWTDYSSDLHKRVCIKCEVATEYAYHTYPPEWSLFASDQHRRACTAECGRYEYEDHSFSSWTPYTTSLHQHTCTKCGFMQTSGHTYDNCLDTICNDCGDDRDPASGIANADGHAYIDCSSRYCSRPECGHDRGTVSGILNADTHVYTNCSDAACNRCSHSRGTATGYLQGGHMYSNYCTDTTCNRSGCGYVRTAPGHSYNVPYWYNVKTAGVCREYRNYCTRTACNHYTVVSTDTSHTYSAWTRTSTTHTRTCTTCGRVDSGNHNWAYNGSYYYCTVCSMQKP